MFKQNYLYHNFIKPHAKQFFTLAIIILNIWCWYDVAYYQDEFIFRLISGRFIQDGTTPMGIYSMCESWLTPVPGVMRLPAFATSWWYMNLSLFSTRLFASLSFVYLFIALTWKTGNRNSSLLILGGLIGVASSTIGYTRPEYLHLINISSSILIIKTSKDHTKTPIKTLLGLLLLFSLLLSLYNHSQGILFLPLNILAIFSLFKNQRNMLLVFLLTFSFCSYSAWEYKSNSMLCDSAPAIKKDLSEHTHKLSELPRVLLTKAIASKISDYLEKFKYQSSFQSNHLPTLKVSKTMRWLNTLITLCVLLTLFLATYVSFISVRILIDQLFNRLHSFETTQIERTLLTTLVLLPTLFLFVVNADQNFYRNFFVHILLITGLALHIEQIKSKDFVYRFRLLWMVLFCFVALISTYLNLTTIHPLLSSQNNMYGENWNVVNTEKTLPESCEIDITIGRLLVDANSYETIKSSSYLYPIEYIFFQSRKTNIPPNRIVKNMHMQGMVYTCDNKNSSHLCCKKFN